MSALSALFAREWRQRLRGGGWSASVGLFVLSVGLAPLSLGRDPDILAAAAPAVLWLAASLSLLIGLDGLYEDDMKSGGLEIYALSPVPLSVVVLIKVATAWLVSCLPLVAVAPLAFFALNMDHVLTGTLGFLLGTPALALLTGAIGALCAGLRKGTSLIVFLSLPLFAPALVFGPGAASSEPGVPLLILAAFSLQALAISPFVAAAALRAHLE